MTSSSISKDLRKKLARTDYIRYELADYHGISRSKVVPTRQVLGKGKSSTLCNAQDMFIYYGVLGMSTTSEPVMLGDIINLGCFPNVRLLPDWDTFTVLPAPPPNNNKSSTGYRTGRVLCELGGEPGEAYPRTICQKLLRELSDEYAYDIVGTFEYEFTIGKKIAALPLSHAGDDKEEHYTYRPCFDGRPIFSTTEFSKLQDLLYGLDQELRLLGIEVHTMNIEYGQGQVEITTLPVAGILIADHAFTFKTAVKEYFARRDLLATFLCKPFADSKGACNGGHFNHSLWKAPNKKKKKKNKQLKTTTSSPPPHHSLENVLYDTESSCGLSDVAHRWVGGILCHSAGLQALAAPTFSCSNRVRDWSWAPTNASWGMENRTASIRAKAYGNQGTLLEWRAPSATANPYLVLAGVLAAGLDGLRKGLSPPPMLHGNAYGKPDRDTSPSSSSYAKLPTRLSESLEALKGDLELNKSLGDRFVRWFLEVKEHERKAMAEIAHEVNVDKDLPSALHCQQKYLLLL